MRYVRPLFITAALMLGGTLSGQDATPSIDARFSADSVLIGDHFRLKVEIDKDVMQVVEFPTFDKGTLSASSEIEILREGPIDTLKAEGRRVTLGREYTLTSFDEGHYRMGRFPVLFVDKNIVDTLWSRDSLRIVVNTIPVDTVSQTIHDVKAPLQTPLRFAEFGGYLLWSLLGLAALGVIVYLIVKRYRRKPLFGAGHAPDPPHVAAIKRLEKLHAQKLWQSGKQKQYYTGLTDILREYISGRYPVKAMEMTSREILDRMAAQSLPEKPMERLRSILHTADFVKFAKYVPDGDRNEQAYTDAYYFVEETKQNEVEQPLVSPDPLQTATEEERS